LPDLRKVADLKNLGFKSAQVLERIGIYHADELKSVGALQAFVRLKEETNINPSLNFLYAMVGAIEDKHWSKVCQTDKAKLLLALEEHKELQALFKDDEG